MDKQHFIIFSTADWDNPFWTNKQHITDRLAKQGHQVLYIESLGLRRPSLKSHDLGRIVKRVLSFFKGAKKVKPHIWVYSPLVIPLHRFRFIRLLNHYLLVFILSFLKWKLKFKRPIVWTYNPIILPLIQALNPKSIVYHNVDDISASPGMDRETILREEEKLIRVSDHIFCTSRKIFEKSYVISPRSSYYLSNVVDYKHFSQARGQLNLPTEFQNIPLPRIGLVGAISEYKVDLELILKAAQARPRWNWVLIGKVGEGQPETSIAKIKNVSNIHLLGPKAYSELPNYIAHFSACMIPAPINEYTNSMFPMKFYEFMAAGKPIVASNIHSLKELTDAFYSYDSLNSFIESLQKAIDEGVVNPKLCDELSQENTWENRIHMMMEIIDGKRN